MVSDISKSGFNTAKGHAIKQMLLLHKSKRFTFFVV